MLEIGVRRRTFERRIADALALKVKTEIAVNELEGDHHVVAVNPSAWTAAEAFCNLTGSVILTDCTN
jgi:hypothetical protein